MIPPDSSDSSTPDRPGEHHSVVEHFGLLVELPPDEREAALEGMELPRVVRMELERLLALDDRDSGWLDAFAARTLPAALDAILPEGPSPHALDDNWELLDPIGAGGMGVVHRARDRRLDRIVAL